MAQLLDSRFIISTIVVIGFIVACVLLLVVHMDFTQLAGQAFLILIGVLSQSFGTVVTYWLGSSAGSAEKSAQLASIATK